MKHVVEKLELALLTPEIRNSPEQLSHLIAEDFIEFSSSGRIYTKQTIIEFLPFEEPKSFVVQDFKILELSKEVILTTYKVSINSIDSLRSSIWKFNQNSWQMVFHQGTKC